MATIKRKVKAPTSKPRRKPSASGANLQRLGGAATPGSPSRRDLNRLTLPEVQYLNRAKGLTLEGKGPTKRGVFTQPIHRPDLRVTPRPDTELIRPGKGGPQKARPDKQFTPYQYEPTGPNVASRRPAAKKAATRGGGSTRRRAS